MTTDHLLPSPRPARPDPLRRLAMRAGAAFAVALGPMLSTAAAATPAAPAAQRASVTPVAQAATEASSTQAATSAAERNRVRVTEAFDAWAKGGNRFFDDLLSPSVRWTIKGSGPYAGTYVGLDDFVARAVRPFASRLSKPVRPVAVHQVFAHGDEVAVHWDGAATAGDGKPYSNSYVWIFRMKEGRVVEATAFLDLAPYEDVIRRVPAPEAQAHPRSRP